MRHYTNFNVSAWLWSCTCIYKNVLITKTILIDVWSKSCLRLQSTERTPSDHEVNHVIKLQSTERTPSDHEVNHVIKLQSTERTSSDHGVNHVLKLQSTERTPSDHGVNHVLKLQSTERTPSDHGQFLSIFSNVPKMGDWTSFLWY